MNGIDGKIKIAFFSFAHVHTKTYFDCVQRNSNADIIGIYDDIPQRVETICKDSHIPYFSNYNLLLEQQPHIAIVCTENANHLELTLAATEAGVDVLCEKPLGVNPVDMRRMLDACKKANVRLMTAMPNRYIHTLRQARTAIRHGTIGKLIAINATNKGTMPGGWFVKKELSGGGCITDHTVHVVDIVNWILDSSPISVRSFSGNCLFENLGVEDVGVSSFEYPNEVLLTLDSSWSRTPAFPYGRDLTIRFIGTEGTLFADYFSEHNTIYSQKQSKAVWSYYGEDKDQLMIDDMIDCYKTGKQFMISGYDGYLAALAAVMAQRSIAENKKIMWCPEKGILA